MISMADINDIPEYAVTVVKDYYGECLACLRNGQLVAAILLSSACLEVALLDALSFEPWKPVSRRDPKRMNLIDLVDWGRQVGCLSEDAWKRGHKIRDCRNALVHPGTDYEKIVKKYPKMAKRFREEKRDHFLESERLKASLVYRLTSPQLAEEIVSDTHNVLKHIYTRGPFSGGRMMSLETGKNTADS